MRVPRVHVPFIDASVEDVALSPEESHHLVGVLRRSRGDRVVIVAGEGGLYDGEVVEVQEEQGRPIVTVRVLSRAPAPEPALLPWTVAAALVKGDAFELALRVASELGVGRFRPVTTARTVVRVRDKARKLERWTKVAVEAAKQCGRPQPMEVLPPESLEDLLKGWKAGDLPGPPGAASCGSIPRGWILVPGAPSLGAVLRERTGARLSPEVFLVGPEGGFTDEEVLHATEAGFRAVGVSTPVLRTPTAVALVGALGVLLAEAAVGGMRAPETPPDCH